MRPAGLLIALLVLIMAAPSARAHDLKPAYLQLRQTAPDTYEILCKVPTRQGRRLDVSIVLPPETTRLTEPRTLQYEDAFAEQWTVQREGGLDGCEIRVEGLKLARLDMIARIVRLDGASQTVRLVPQDASFIVEAEPSVWGVAATYLVLGVEHILLGIDHLLFVLALLLLVKGWRRLIATITAFTIAHSITLALATLHIVKVPGPPVEAGIALSIVFVAAEVVRSRAAPAAASSAAPPKPGLTERAPSIVAFTFGLLHGLGFAGALQEVGLPQQAIPAALLFFNVGVEIGQLAFIAVLLALAAAAGSLPVRRPRWAWRLAPYTIGPVAMYWLIERTSGFF